MGRRAGSSGCPGRSVRSLAVIQRPHAPACAVRLVDRRTGQTHRINGSPLILFTQRPEEAASELLAGRDPLVWEARIAALRI